MNKEDKRITLIDAFNKATKHTRYEGLSINSDIGDGFVLGFEYHPLSLDPEFTKVLNDFTFKAGAKPFTKNRGAKGEEKADQVGYCVCPNLVKLRDGYCENCGGIIPLYLKCDNSLGEEKAEISDEKLKTEVLSFVKNKVVSIKKQAHIKLSDVLEAVQLFKNYKGKEGELKKPLSENEITLKFFKERNKVSNEDYFGVSIFKGGKWFKEITGLSAVSDILKAMSENEDLLENIKI